jgi:hypothetical protein
MRFERATLPAHEKSAPLTGDADVFHADVSMEETVILVSFLMSYSDMLETNN